MKRYTDKVVDATDAPIKQAAADTIPNVGPTFWSFRIMMIAGGLNLLLMVAAFVQIFVKQWECSHTLPKTLLWGIPLPWIAAESGWFLAEYGRVHGQFTIHYQWALLHLI